VEAIQIAAGKGNENHVALAVKAAKENGLCKTGNKVIVVLGSQEDSAEESNTIKIIDVE
jgi:hypothetical protein